MRETKAPTVEYCWGLSDERFDERGYPTREAAAGAAFAESDPDEAGVYTAVVVPVTVPTVNADSVIEQAREDMDEQVGEVGEIWLERVSHEEEAELCDRLTAEFTRWLADHGHWPANVWGVTGIEFHPRTAEVPHG
ncbi:MAG TPA: hypothetical protein VFQ38_09055 [Longimicrobiales bacterium]|nr:hypothetical protein [Longimicrobiales bacterium]